MRNFILASVSALALFGVAACSDNTDNATTQSVTPPAEAPADTAPAVNPNPQTGTGGDMQSPTPTQPAAPAQ